MAVSLNFSGNNLYRRQRQDFINQRYDEIYAHEKAHKNAAGSYGGAVVIEKNQEGIPVGGHVDIQMPVLDKNNPENTIEHADIVIKSAMAPDDPSNQDYKVAAAAKNIKLQAENERNRQLCGQKLNYTA